MERETRKAVAASLAATAAAGGAPMIGPPAIGWLLIASVPLILFWGWWPKIRAIGDPERQRKARLQREEEAKEDARFFRRMDRIAGRGYAPENGEQPSSATTPSAVPDKAVSSSNSRAFTKFEREGDTIYLKVTNKGITSAVFWARIEPAGPTMDIPDGSCAQWVHSDDAKTSIPSGETRKLKVAQYKDPLHGYGRWRVTYLLDDAVRSVTSPHALKDTFLPFETRLATTDVTVTLRADPELRGGAIIRRIELDYSGRWSIRA